MRNILSLSFVLFLILSGGGFLSTAHAQEETCPDQGGNAGIISANDGLCHYFDTNGVEIGTGVDPTVTEDPGGLIPPPDPAAEKTVKDYEPGKADEAYSEVMVQIMRLFAWLVGVAALTLDYTVYYTVVKMGAIINNLSAVGVTWRILRDIGNIMLIFGFIMAGIMTILNVTWYGFSTKMLPMLLVAAVFLNFSLFISEAIIDTGNLFATQFYTQINGGRMPTAEGLRNTEIATEGISNRLMGQMGLQTIYGNLVSNGKATEIFKTGANPWLIGFMGVLLFIVVAFVMFTLSFVLIARFVVLLFLIVVSPIGFAGKAIPKLEALSARWWSTLAEQTLTAPVLFLLLYVALAVILDANFLSGFLDGGRADWLGSIVKDPSGRFNYGGFASVVLSFLVAMGLLLAVIIFAKNMSAFGAGVATKLGGRVTGALSFGAISLAGRGTLGTLGYAMNSKRMQARAAEKGFGGSMARLASFTGSKLENRTFDFRNIPGVRAAGSSVGGIMGNGLGEVFAGGSQFTTKTVTDKAEKTWKDYKPGGEHWREQQKEYEKAKKEADRKETLVAPSTRVFSTPLEKEEAENKFNTTLRKMSADELAQLKGIREGVDDFAQALTSAQFGELMKGDKLTSQEKENVKKARFRPVTDSQASISTLKGQLDAGLITKTQFDTAAAPHLKKIAASLKTFSKSEMEALPPALQNDPIFVGELANDQFEALSTLDVLTESQKLALKARRAEGLKARLTRTSVYTNPPTDPVAPGMTVQSRVNPGQDMTEGERAISAMSNEDVAKLPDAVLELPEVHQTLKVSQIAAIQKAEKIQDSTAYTIGRWLEGSLEFRAYYVSRNAREKADIKRFWHLNWA